MGKIWELYKKAKHSHKLEQMHRARSDVGLIFKDMRKSAQFGQLARLDRAFNPERYKKKK